MPEQDGYSPMRQVSAALGPNSPRAAVALTAFAGARRIANAPWLPGFHRHVAKPVDPIALVRLLEDLLGERV